MTERPATSTSDGIRPQWDQPHQPDPSDLVGPRPTDQASDPPLRGEEPCASGELPDDELPAHASAHLLSTSLSRLNRIRAGVLGCNDGITSTAGLVVGVAAAHVGRSTLAFAGLAGLAAGSLSMGGGEFTSVQAQRDSQETLLRVQRAELETIPHEELDELAHLYMQRGLSLRLAREVAVELTARDALAAHAEAELGINLTDLVNPWEASLVSALSYLLGGTLALLAILLPPAGVRVATCVAIALLGLAATGFLAARLGSAPTGRATLRNLFVGSATMLVTYALGTAAHAFI